MPERKEPSEPSEVSAEIMEFLERAGVYRPEIYSSDVLALLAFTGSGQALQLLMKYYPDAFQEEISPPDRKNS